MNRTDELLRTDYGRAALAALGQLPPTPRIRAIVTQALAHNPTLSGRALMAWVLIVEGYALRLPYRESEAPELVTGRVGLFTAPNVAGAPAGQPGGPVELSRDTALELVAARRLYRLTAGDLPHRAGWQSMGFEGDTADVFVSIE